MKVKAKNIIQLAFQVGMLKRIKRHGWLLRGIRNGESVADHSFRVTFLTMILSNNQKVNKEKALIMALIHDLGVAVIGDIVYEHGRNIDAALKYKHEDEKNALIQIFKEIGGKEKYLSLWDEFVSQKTPEAKFVKQVEKIEMAIQALEYEREGYDPKLFEEFWENAKKYLDKSELEYLFKELEKERKG